MEGRSGASAALISLQGSTGLFKRGPLRAVVAVALGGREPLRLYDVSITVAVGPQSGGKYRHQTQQSTMSDVKAQMEPPLLRFNNAAEQAEWVLPFWTETRPRRCLHV